MAGVVREIWRYPAKSMLGDRVERAELLGHGMVGDRMWAVRDGVRGGIRGAKKISGLMRLSARYLVEPDGSLPPPPIEIRLPDGTVTGSQQSDVDARLSDALGHPVALEALRPILDQCMLVKGISGVPITPFGSAPHALELSTWLTASLPNAAKRNQINIAISADQIFANYYGALTALPSLELATMPQTHKENQEGLNEGYYSHCSFRSPTQAMPAEINPRSVLNRLFGQTNSGGQTAAADPLGEEQATEQRRQRMAEVALCLGGSGHEWTIRFSLEKVNFPSTPPDPTSTACNPAKHRRRRCGLDSAACGWPLTRGENP